MTPETINTLAADIQREIDAAYTRGFNDGWNAAESHAAGDLKGQKLAKAKTSKELFEAMRP